MDPEELNGSLDVKIVTMEEEHLPEVIRIEFDSFANPWSPALFRRALKDAMTRSFIAQIREKVVGYAVFWVVGDFAELGDIAVDRPWRGKGIGETLLVDVIDACRSLGATSLFLEVRASNSVAQGLYRKAGFEEISRRERYYSHPAEDALVLGLDLERANPPKKNTFWGPEENPCEYRVKDG